MSDAKKTLCFLGCGNLGRAILGSLVKAKDGSLPFTRYIACVRSSASKQLLEQKLSDSPIEVAVYTNDNVKAVQDSDVVILGVDPADVAAVLRSPEICKALKGKVLISIAAGWTREKIESLIGHDNIAQKEGDGGAWVVRTLPNIAALVSQSLTAIEISDPAVPDHVLDLAQSIFDHVGRTVRLPPRLMDATTAVGGSTPAFFAVICDALVDASVAIGVPRDSARLMIAQSMLGTATMLTEGGLSPAELRDQGTSPEGCTIAGLMVLEENAVRGYVGRALREAVTAARLMGTIEHVNDTRQP